MSFILDALKKSEQERERRQQPAMVDISYGRRTRSQPVWMLLVIGLLLLNCLLLLIMWWRNTNPPAVNVQPVATTATTTDSTNAAAVARIITPPRAAEVRPLQDEAGNDAESVAVDETAALLAAEDVPTGPPLVKPASALEQAMAQQESFANSVKAAGANGGGGQSPRIGNDNVTSLDSLGGSGALNLPDLRLDVHVYSSVAAERFVFVNSRKYSEGQTLSEGPHVERITQDGVILSYRNQRFVLPRQ